MGGRGKGGSVGQQQWAVGLVAGGLIATAIAANVGTLMGVAALAKRFNNRTIAKDLAKLRALKVNNGVSRAAFRKMYRDMREGINFLKKRGAIKEKDAEKHLKALRRIAGRKLGG